MASFRKRANGKWEFRVRIKSNGKWVEKSQGGFDKKKDAEKAARVLETQVDNGVKVLDSEMLIPVFLREFLESYKKGMVSENTYRKYEIIVRVHVEPYFKNTKLKDLNRLDYTKFITELSELKSLNTIMNINGFFNDSINVAVNELGILHRNPISRMKLSRLVQEDHGDSSIKCYELDELNDFLSRVKENKNGYKYFVLFTFLSRTGLRIGEALALQWDDLDFENRTVTVSKTLHTRNLHSMKFTKPKTKSSNRTISVDGDTISLLQKWKIEQAKNILRYGVQNKKYSFIFTSERNNVISNASAVQIMVKICARNHIRYITVHGLRHTHAVHLLQSGADLKSVSTRLGHATINMTANVYLHVLKSMEEKTMNNYENFLKNMGNHVGRY